MRVLDLFSGIGGMALGLSRAGMDISALCEKDEFCQKVLARHWPDTRIYTDVHYLDGQRVLDDVGSIDLVAGGVPCQPFSQVGKREGEGDDRHLWPEMYRIITEVRPRWVIAENVTGIISLGLDTVLSDLERAGYAWWAFVIPAVSLNAKHIRERVWVVAYAERLGLERFWPDTDAQGRDRSELAASRLRCGNEVWDIEPDVDRVADGLSARVDRCRALGNAVVPQIPELIGHCIMEGYELPQVAAAMQTRS